MCAKTEEDHQLRQFLDHMQTKYQRFISYVPNNQLKITKTYTSYLFFTRVGGQSLVREIGWNIAQHSWIYLDPFPESELIEIFEKRDKKARNIYLPFRISLNIDAPFYESAFAF